MSYYHCTNKNCNIVLISPEKLYRIKANKNRIKCPKCGKYQNMKELKAKMKELGHDPEPMKKKK